MKEIPKRLAPTDDTLREIYLKSGNCCAFSGCARVIFTNNGDFVGQICHIEAAMPGGERFNPKQTNEERRHVSNLLLMCYDHHIETDDVARFSVEAMKRIKSDHENKFSDIIGTMYLSVSDHTERGIPVFPKTLARMNRILGWKLTSDELDEIIKTSRISFEKIVQIPLPTRKLFRIMLTRAHKCNYHGQTDLEVSVPDLQQATGLSDDNFWSCISILDKAGLIDEAGTDDFGVQLIGIKKLKSDGLIWSDLVAFYNEERLPLVSAIENLDFSGMD